MFFYCTAATAAVSFLLLITLLLFTTSYFSSRFVRYCSHSRSWTTACFWAFTTSIAPDEKPRFVALLWLCVYVVWWWFDALYATMHPCGTAHVFSFVFLFSETVHTRIFRHIRTYNTQLLLHTNYYHIFCSHVNTPITWFMKYVNLSVRVFM